MPQPLHRHALLFLLAVLALGPVGRAQEGVEHKPTATSPASKPAANADHGPADANMQRLLAAILAQAKTNQGDVPASLRDLGPHLAPGDSTLESLLKNPRLPELGANGYIYVPAQEKNIERIGRPNDRVAIYEAGDFGDGVLVGFWDGHTEFVAKRSEFDALLAAVVPRSTTPRRFDPNRPETFGRVDEKASAAAQSFQIVRELTEAVVMYTNDNRNRAPADIKHLGAYLLQPNELTPPSYLTNPRRPQHQDKGYNYIVPKGGRLRVDYKLPPDKRGLDQLPVIYEAGDVGEGIFIGFWDGHAEYVRGKEDVERILAQPELIP